MSKSKHRILHCLKEELNNLRLEPHVADAKQSKPIDDTPLDGNVQQEHFAPEVEVDKVIMKRKGQHRKKSSESKDHNTKKNHKESTTGRKRNKKKEEVNGDSCGDPRDGSLQQEHFAPEIEVDMVSVKREGRHRMKSSDLEDHNAQENHQESTTGHKRKKKKGKLNGDSCGDPSTNVMLDGNFLNIDEQSNLSDMTSKPIESNSGLYGIKENKVRTSKRGKKRDKSASSHSKTCLELQAEDNLNICYLEEASETPLVVSKEEDRKTLSKNPSESSIGNDNDEEKKMEAPARNFSDDADACLHSSVKSEKSRKKSKDKLTKEIDQSGKEYPPSGGLTKGPDFNTNGEQLILGKPLIVVKRKLLVLDLNGLLADIIYKGRCSRSEGNRIGKRAVFKRPFYEEFLDFCFKAFDVAIWSSRKKEVLDRVLDHLMGESKHELLFCWDQEKCTTAGCNTLEARHKPMFLKELKKLWGKEHELPWESGKYTSSNTLLIDDSPYKSILNPPYTAIFPHSYSYLNQNDNSLGPRGDIRVFLEGLIAAPDVRHYVRDHRFGQPPITEKDPNWNFYVKIIQKLRMPSRRRS